MADFNFMPDFVYEEGVESSTIITEFENGVEQRRSKWGRVKRKFKLVFKNRTKSEFEDVRDFFINKLGAYQSFTWENPNDNVVYTVRFEENGLTFRNKAFDVYDFELGLVEVWA